MEEEPPHTVTVKVLRGNGLSGRRSSFQSWVKVELDDVLLGESEKTQRDPSQNCFHFDFSCSFHVSRDHQAVAELARKLLVVTVWDFLPEEKKAEARSVVLGQAVVDLLPLLHGQTHVSLRAPVHSGASAQPTGRDRKALLPLLELELSVAEALMSSEALSGSNLLKVTVETAFSVPEAWTPASRSSPTSCSYTTALELPVCTEKNQTVVFSRGALKAGGAREEPGRPKKRPFLPQLLPANTVLPGASVTTGPVELEDGELTGPKDRFFREDSETRKNRVTWDVEQNCFLNSDATNRLRETITKYRLWPVEIMSSTVGNKTQSPDEKLPFHGVAFVDMGRLLFPGVTRLRGAYGVEPFSQNLLLHKAKRSRSVLRQHVEAVAAAARASSAAGKRAGNKTPAKKREEDNVTEKTTEPPNAQANVYSEARTYIILEVSLEKPLVPKTSPEELSRRVMALVPPKPPVTPRLSDAEQAVQSFQEQVESVASHVSEQLDSLCGEHLADVDREVLKKQVMGELNLSGTYFTIREQLKPVVARFVRDKMQQTEPISDPRQRLEFVSRLYADLMDETHRALNKIFSHEEEELPTEKPAQSQAQTRRFAAEAQSVGDYELALQYHQELLVLNPKDPQNMFELGRHFMLTADFLKAKEYFYDAVATDPRHQASLIMCGVLSMLFERHEEAQIFLEQAATMEKHGVVAWTLLGLLHLSREDEILAERSFLEADKLQKYREPQKLREILKHWVGLVKQRPPEEPPEDTEGGQRQRPPEDTEGGQRQDEATDLPSPQEKKKQPENSGSGHDATVKAVEIALNEENPDSNHVGKSSEREKNLMERLNVFTETVDFLLQNHALQMAERALAQEVLSPEGGLTVSYLLHLAHLQLYRGDYCSAVANLEEALRHNDENAQAWALKGHCHLLQGDICRAQESYESTLTFRPPPADTHLVLLRLGNIYQQNSQFERAKELYLEACEKSPSCLTWLGLGVACYQLGEQCLAERALTEANHLNNRNSQVWIYLAFICLQSGRLEEAERFYKYALQFKLQDEKLLRDYQEMHEEARFSFLSHLFQRQTGAECTELK